MTAFFIGEDIGEVSNDGIPLMRELERQLQTFGSHLKPYVREREIDAAVFLCPEEQAAGCSVCFAFHPTDGRIGMMTERYIFSSLHDFLFVELGKAILRGSAPRQCRLCGRWFLHEQGDRAMYCERVAPGETEQTCRETGARAVFEKKIQEVETFLQYIAISHTMDYIQQVNSSPAAADIGKLSIRTKTFSDNILLCLETTSTEEEYLFLKSIHG